VSWGEPKRTYPVSVRIKAYDRDGLMKDVATLVTNEGINMGNVKVGVDHTNNEYRFHLILKCVMSSSRDPA
jgi:GTP pyrophosphokinase